MLVREGQMTQRMSDTWTKNKDGEEEGWLTTVVNQINVSFVYKKKKKSMPNNCG